MIGSSNEKSSRRLLDPIDRTSEVLFGLIMALTFTCTISAAESGREDVRALLVGAIGCNVAWGLIDAVIFLVISLTERARSFAMLCAVRRATEPERARSIIADALPPLVAENLSNEHYAHLQQRIAQLETPRERPRLGKDEYLAALGIFLLVFLATFPVVIPFIIMKDAMAALRVSNAIALVMLFLAGFALGRYAHYRPWLLGLLMAIIGSVLVVITIALGG
jgi:hypothetical protein